MKRFGGVILTLGLILTMGTAALADGFQMDKVTVGAKWVEDEDNQYWIYANSNAKYDWMRMNLQGKFYFEELSDNWIDFSRDGMDDLYSGVRANFRFPEFSKGLDANLGYKQNKNYDVFLYGVGYNWGFGRNLGMGLHYDAANRNTLDDSLAGGATHTDTDTGEVDEETGGDLRRRQEEFTLDYTPKGWGYNLAARRIDSEYPDQESDDLLQYVLDQKLSWQATSKVDLGLRYLTKTTQYSDQSGWDDGKSNLITLSGTLKWSENWTWSSAYSTWDHTGRGDIGNNGDRTAEAEADSNSWNIKAKYTPNANWWAAAKLFVSDRTYNDVYRNQNLDASDIDADYNSRTQQTVALEFEQKLAAFTYNLELFVKNYDYKDDILPRDAYEDGTDAGIIGAIAWDWVDWHWVFRAAPNGDLSTRKANYELKATYKF